MESKEEKRERLFDLVDAIFCKTALWVWRICSHGMKVAVGVYVIACYLQLPPDHWVFSVPERVSELIFQ